MDILWANSDLTVEAKHLGATAWKPAEHLEAAGTLLALPVRRLRSDSAGPRLVAPMTSTQQLFGSQAGLM